MSTAPKQTPREPQETDLLVPFEIQNIPADYREYYRVKRHNLFASIQGFRDMWDYYLALDKIWLREFADLKPMRDANRMFPLMLYINAHAKIRVALELAFSGCLAEARSILRDAVESVAHGHAMVVDAELQKTWLSKNDDKAALEAFKDAFERHKKEGLFKGLDELYKNWGQLAETGSHTTINALCDRFVSINSETEIEFRLNYSGAEPKAWSMQLFWMLLACFKMEETFFKDYESRLTLDVELLRMRSEFEQRKENLRRTLIDRYQIKPPQAQSVILSV